MIRGFYTARSGLIAHQEHMSVMANNLANTNTSGFKPMRTAFKDLMYQNLNRVRNENEAQTGHGIKINKNDIMMNEGVLETTNRVFDFAIMDKNGFFAVETPTGDIRYTRSGDFVLSNVDDAFYLTTGDGAYVLDADGGQIEVEFDEFNNMDFDPSIVGVYRFPNPWGLSSVEGTTFMPTEMSGEAEAVEEPSIQNGVLEGAAVDIGAEMANVIEASKAFSFSSRMVQVADEIEQTVNSMRQ